MASRYASRRASASERTARSGTAGAKAATLRIEGEGRAIGDALRADLHQADGLDAQVGAAIAGGGAIIGDRQRMGRIGDGEAGAKRPAMPQLQQLAQLQELSLEELLVKMLLTLRLNQILHL